MNHLEVKINTALRELHNNSDKYGIILVNPLEIVSEPGFGNNKFYNVIRVLDMVNHFKDSNT
ncbi:MAG: hypothetical protein HRU03_03760 [Nanoarchaeales archaeon]|nr:hypothetical protein [Nanoarchaeales archaeon]